MRRALTVVLGWKLIILLFFLLLFLRVPLEIRYPHHIWVPEGSTRSREINRAQEEFLPRLAPCDGQYYLQIASTGYTSGEDRAFFPLFPALARAGRLLGLDPLPAGLLLNLVLGAAGLMIVSRIIEDGLGRSAVPTLLLLLVFPSAGFFHLFYTESLFLFLSATCLHSVLKGRFALAAVAGFLGGLTRPQGVLLCLPILAQALKPQLRAKDAEGRRGLPLQISASFAPVVGAAAFLIYLSLRGGSLVSPLETQGAWGRSFGLEAVGRLFSVGPSRFPTDVAAATLGLALIPLLFRFLPLPLALFGAASAIFPLTTGSLLSYFRFLAVSFPHLIALSFLLEKRPCLWLLTFVGFLSYQSLIDRNLLAWIYLA